MKHVGRRDSPQDIASQEQLGGGGGGPSGAEAIATDNAFPQTVQLALANSYKVIRAQQAGHTFVLPAAAPAGTTLTLAFARHGGFLRDSEAARRFDIDAVSLAYCTKTAAGWQVSCTQLATPVATANETLLQTAGASFLAMERLTDTTAIVSWGSHTRIVQFNSDGTVTLGPLVAMMNGYDRALLVVSPTKVICLWRAYAQPHIYSVLTVSGLTVTAAAPVTFEATTDLRQIGYVKLQDNKFLITSMLGATTQLVARILIFNPGDNSIAISAPLNLPTPLRAFNGLCRLSAARVLVAYSAAAYAPRFIQIDTSAAAPTLVGSESSIAGSSMYEPALGAVDSTTALYVYRSNGGLTAQILSIAPAGPVTVVGPAVLLSASATRGAFIDCGDGRFQLLMTDNSRRAGTYVLTLAVVGGTEIQVGRAVAVGYAKAASGADEWPLCAVRMTGTQYALAVAANQDGNKPIVCTFSEV